MILTPPRRLFRILRFAGTTGSIDFFEAKILMGQNPVRLALAHNIDMPEALRSGTAVGWRYSLGGDRVVWRVQVNPTQRPWIGDRWHSGMEPSDWRLEIKKVFTNGKRAACDCLPMTLVRALLFSTIRFTNRSQETQVTRSIERLLKPGASIVMLIGDLSFPGLVQKPWNNT